MVWAGNTKGGSITVLLTSCLTGLESAVWQLTIFVLIAKQTNPYQSYRRSMVQWYFPPLVFLVVRQESNLAHACFVPHILILQSQLSLDCYLASPISHISNFIQLQTPSFSIRTFIFFPSGRNDPTLSRTTPTLAMPKNVIRGSNGGPSPSTSSRRTSSWYPSTRKPTGKIHRLS